MQAWWYNIWVWLVVCLLVNALPAYANEDAFLAAKPPKRIALVVGNSDYVTAAKLPGSQLDADKMEEILGTLDFKVTKVKDVRTRAEFQIVHFLPFVQSIGEGDIVVFYFSGHGFTYGGENYLAPLQFPATVKSGDVFTTFISASSLHTLLNERHPSFVLMLLDACRNIGDFIDPFDAAAVNLVAKGLAAARVAADNIVIGFSSDAGAISFGSADVSLSVYTEALSEFLPSPARDLDDIRKEVRFSVRFKTDNKQVPWFSDSSSAEVYFKPSAEVLAQEREAWIATLEEGTRRAVARFLSRHGTGPFGSAAREWLLQNQQAATVRVSAVSPALPEIAWVTRPEKAVRLPRIEGPLAPNASIAVAQKRPERGFPSIVDSATGLELGITPELGPRTAAFPTSHLPSSVSEALTTLGEAVVTRPVEARTRPRADAPTSRTLPTGTRVLVDGVNSDAQGNTWVRGRVSDNRDTIYVEQQQQLPTATVPTVDIGRPLTEVTVSGRARGLKSLVDEGPLLKAIEDIKSSGKQITWVSIATPKSKATGEDSLYGLRAVHVRSILASNGVPRDRVTTVEGLPLADDDLRIRIFGQ